MVVDFPLMLLDVRVWFLDFWSDLLRVDLELATVRAKLLDFLVVVWYL